MLTGKIKQFLKRKEVILRYGVSLLLISIIFVVLVQSDYLSLLKKVSPGELAISITLCFFIFSFSGYKIGYLTAMQFQKSLNIKDIVGLPIAMNLWSFLIPIKGGLLYSILFLKMKYKIKTTEGTAVGIFIYLITLMLTGGFGLFYTISNNHFISIGTLLSIILILSPLLIVYFASIFQYFSFNNVFLIRKVYKIIHTINMSLVKLIRNFRANVMIIILSLSQMVLRILWFYWATIVLDLNVPILKIIILVLILELSIIIRFLPGNLGLNELISGGAFSVLGGRVEEGILITLFIRISTLLLTFTIGIWTTIANMKYFNMNNVKAMWIRVKNS